MRARILCLSLFLGWVNPALAQLADPDLVTAFLARREALLNTANTDLPEMSTAIRTAVTEAEKVVDTSPQEALDRLAPLSRFGTLTELPSFDVHMLSSFAYMKLGNQAAAAAHRARADALREILQMRIGSGRSPEDPLQAIMLNDITEWARSAMAQFGDVRQIAKSGKPIYAATCSGQACAGGSLYFTLPVRKALAEPRLFDPLPLAGMPFESQARLRTAQEKRANFLAAPGLRYLELSAAMGEALARASQKMATRRPAEAIVELRSLERFRPIEEIPTPELIALYSAAFGQLGDTGRQQELRSQLFGINQAIAHSGDGRAPETAIKVLFISEEYAWMRDRGLKVVRQETIAGPNDGKLDLLIGEDASGNQSSFLFDVTPLFAQYARELSPR